MATFSTFRAFFTNLIVHKDHTGALLGTKHRTITEMARRFNTRIIYTEIPDIATTAPPMVKFTIMGRSEKDIGMTYNALLAMAQRADAQTPRSQTMPDLDRFEVSEMEGREARCTISNQDMPLVMGAKKRTINKITNDTWTWFKLFNHGNATTISIRGFGNDSDNAANRVFAIATESFNRRFPSPPIANGTISMNNVAGDFKMAPVPKHRKKNASPNTPPISPSAMASPPSPDYAPSSPDYAPPNSGGDDEPYGGVGGPNGPGDPSCSVRVN
jgi:hypothetical protein